MNEKEYVKKNIILMAICFIFSISVLLAIKISHGEFHLFGIKIQHLILILFVFSWGWVGYYLKLRLVGRLKEVDSNKFNSMNLELKYFGGGEGPREAINLLKFIFSNDDFGDEKIRLYKIQMRIDIIASPIIFITLIIFSYI